MLETTPSDSSLYRLRAVRERIESACRRFDRDPGEVTLVAVSKTHSADAVRDLLSAGQRDFAENYLQEAVAKVSQLAESEILWHFIGHIQSNKCAQIARHFHWVHSVDRARVAQRLDAAARELGKQLDILVQVNIEAESSKSGVLPQNLTTLLDDIQKLQGVRLRGLMVIPKPAVDFADQRRPFAAARELMRKARDAGHELDCLSMGMSADLEAAIAEGSTHVRVGTALFGPRDYSDQGR